MRRMFPLLRKNYIPKTVYFLGGLLVTCLIFIAVFFYTASTAIPSNGKLVKTSQGTYIYVGNGKEKGDEKSKDVLGVKDTKVNQETKQDISFADSSKGLPSYTMGSDDVNITFRYVPKEKVPDNYRSVVSGNKITYENVAKDTNIIYTIQNENIIKEDIELTKKPIGSEQGTVNREQQETNTNKTVHSPQSTVHSSPSYTFDIILKGLTYETNPDGILIPIFKNKVGLEYSIPPLVMKDAKGNTSTDINMVITPKKNAEGKTIVLSAVLTPSSSWLQDKERSYPVLIDPTLIKGDAPVLSMNFDEGYGQTTQDASTNNNDGTLGATSGAESSDPTWKTEDQCISGKCLYFDGTDDYVNAGSATSLDDINIVTISAWIKPNSYGEGNYGRIVDKGLSSGATFGRGLFLCNDGGVNCNVASLSFLQNFDGTDGWWSTPANSVSLNTWSHVVVVYDRSSASNNPVIYINGKEQTLTENNSPSGSARSDATYNLYIGNRLNDDRTFMGTIDSVRIYNYARTSTQVRQDYSAKGGVMGAAAQFGASDTNQKLSDGLVGYWKMDEASWTGDCATDAAMDSSGNGINGDACPNGSAPSPSGGKFGNAGSFNGTSQYINLGNQYQFTSSFSVSAWYYQTDNDDNNHIITKLGGTSARDWDLRDEGGGAVFTVATSASTAISLYSSYDLPTQNSWQHVVGVYDASVPEMYIYVNGKLDGTYGPGVPTAITTTTNNVRIGSRESNSQYFSGKIDDVRVYNRALSEGEARDLYEWAPGSIAYWNFDEGSGQFTNDKSGNSLSGTLGSSSGDANQDPTWVTGKFGNALDFNQSNTQYVDIGNQSKLYFPNSFTLSMWVKRTGTPSSMWGGYLLSDYSHTCTAASFAVRIDQANTASFFWEYPGGTTREATSTTVLPLNTWAYVTAVYDGTTRKIYVNGVLEGTNNTAQARSDNGTTTTIGRPGACADMYAPAAIDEVRIFNYARTPAQIIEDMNAGHPVGGSPVGSQVGYWKFDEGYGDTTYDWSPQRKNADLSGSTTCPSATVCPTWNSSGKFGKAMYFGGLQTADGDSLVRLPNDAYDTLTEGAISLWVKPDDAGDTNQNIISVAEDDDGAGSDLLGLQLDNSTNQMTFGALDNGTLVLAASAPAISDYTSWHHFVWNMSTAGNELYMDGVKQNVTYTTGSASTDVWFDNVSENTTSYTLGCTDVDASDSNDCYDTTESLQGYLDEVKIYSAPLTADQVRTEYLGGVGTKLGAKSTTSGGVADNSASREYCVPGDATSCSAPIGIWNFDENSGTSTNDSSGNNHNCTFQSMPSQPWVPGKAGSALDFQMSDDGVNCGNTFGNTSAMSLSAWIKPRTGSTWYQIVTKADDAAPGVGWLWEMNMATSSLEFWVGTNDQSLIRAATGVISPDQWQHVGLTWDGSLTAANIRMFVNGKEATYTTTTNGTNVKDDDSAQNLVIGLASNNGDDFDGYIDQVRMYDYVRTPAQIAWDYNRSAPIAWYKFDECTGTNVDDWAPSASGGYLNKDGTITIGSGGSNSTGAGSCSTSGAWYDGVDGKFGASLDFDGTDDQVSMGNIVTIEGSAEATVCAWIKYAPADVTTDGAIVSRYLGSTAGWLMWVDDVAGYSAANNTISFSVDASVTGGRVEGTEYLVTTGEWDQYCGVFKGGSYIRLYKNGILNTENTSSIVATVNTDNANLYIGRIDHATPRWFEGLIDDVRIYNYALTPAQIKSTYSGSAVGFR